MDIVALVAAGVVALLGGGVLFERFASWRTRRRYQTPPGEWVDLGTHRLHIRIMGQAVAGQPTVILDAGVGSNSLDWALVQPRVAEFAQVVAYDRAGYGWSEKGPDPRTSERIVAELHQLLLAKQIEPPYLLVGHSFGGIYMRAFAQAYPDAVAGLVLVDSSHPGMIEERETEPEIRRLKNVRRFQQVGLLRLMLPRILHRADHLPDQAARQRYIAFTLLDSANNLREALPLFEDSIDLPDHVGFPVTVISRRPDEDLNAEVNWQKFQTDLMMLSEQTRQVFSEKSSHFIPLADPDLVVKSIQEMLDPATQTTADEATD